YGPPGQVYEVEGAGVLDQGEGQGRGVEEGRNAEGGSRGVDADAAAHPERRDDGRPAAPGDPLGQDEEVVRARGDGERHGGAEEVDEGGKGHMRDSPVRGSIPVGRAFTDLSACKLVVCSRLAVESLIYEGGWVELLIPGTWRSSSSQFLIQE